MARRDGASRRARQVHPRRAKEHTEHNDTDVASPSTPGLGHSSALPIRPPSNGSTIGVGSSLDFALAVGISGTAASGPAGGSRDPRPPIDADAAPNKSIPPQRPPSASLEDEDIELLPATPLTPATAPTATEASAPTTDRPRHARKSSAPGRSPIYTAIWERPELPLSMGATWSEDGLEDDDTRADREHTPYSQRGMSSDDERGTPTPPPTLVARNQQESRLAEFKLQESAWGELNTRLRRPSFSNQKVLIDGLAKAGTAGPEWLGAPNPIAPGGCADA